MANKALLVILDGWGVGNHGGGPSKIDLESINEFAADSDKEIIHSFFSIPDYLFYSIFEWIE